MSERDDYAEELRGDGEEVSNTKQGSLGQVILAGLIVALGSWGLGKITDSSRETQTAAVIATLIERVSTQSERVSTLTEQVRRLNDQPYVRREEFSAIESRMAGFERRVDSMEQRTGTPRR